MFSPSWIWTNDKTVNSRLLYHWAIGDLETQVFFNFSCCGYCFKNLKQHQLSGVKGFEPLTVGSKFRCLTTWLHPMTYTCILLLFFNLMFWLFLYIKTTKTTTTRTSKINPIFFLFLYMMYIKKSLLFFLRIFSSSPCFSNTSLENSLFHNFHVVVIVVFTVFVVIVLKI